MAKVTIINYGLGNINAFANIYNRLNISVEIASTVGQLKRAKKIILPGVGAFDWAMSRLNESGLRSELEQLVLVKKVPVLGVCVGMQMMACNSDEGKLPGLGWIKANVTRFSDEQVGIRPVPHMGWNDVYFSDTESLFHGMESPRFYFLHSYFIVPHNTGNILATTQYGDTFTAAVFNGKIFGTQFHPEKSHQSGIKLLQNFIEL
jgi:imidazole glycerol-phosphate synthase subunit HisH